jgi:hypothetical protein
MPLSVVRIKSGKSKAATGVLDTPLRGAQRAQRKTRILEIGFPSCTCLDFSFLCVPLKGVSRFSVPSVAEAFDLDLDLS